MMTRFTYCLLAAFLVGATAVTAADYDIARLQRQLAEQEARLTDLQAKMNTSSNASAPEAIVSMRKNATVTIGGAVTTSYFFNAGTVEVDTGAGYRKTDDIKNGSLEVSDADLELQVDVSDHFDAYLIMKLHQTDAASDAAYGVPESYWVRWKNIADTGFGVKIGRDNLVFGDGDSALGYLYNYAHNDGDGHSWWYDYDNNPGGFLPHNNWDNAGVTQIAPYWESPDGKFLFETSFFADMWNGEGAYKTTQTVTTVGDDGVVRDRSRNYGLGSMSARATWTPLEDLHFSASVVNYRTNRIDGWDAANDALAKNNTAVALAFSWRPSFLTRLNIWSQYIHGWNVNHYDGADSDTVNFGFSVDLTEKLSVFLQGDYLHSTFDYDAHRNGSGSSWAAYSGVAYDLGGGAWFEAGWRHETAKRSFDDNGIFTREKIKNDLLYSTIGFEF